jgi:ATP-dependent Clp protease ATP-binding subunit ClpC
LTTLGVTLEETRAQVARIVGEGDEATSGQIPFTPRAKKVLELALREALGLGHNYVGAEHILLGLVREGEGVGARILLDAGVTGEQVRDELMRQLGGVRSSAPRELPKPPRGRRHRSPLQVVVVTWALGAVTLGAGILIGWAIWG